MQAHFVFEVVVFEDILLVMLLDFVLCSLLLGQQGNAHWCLRLLFVSTSYW